MPVVRGGAGAGQAGIPTHHLMPYYRLTVAYDGTGLVGWQRQPSGTSVQVLIEDALRRLDGSPVSAIAAGRTDAGVHALGQVVSVTLDRDIDPHTLLRALNFHLPPAVRVIGASRVDATFHARFSARWKSYRYQMWVGGPMPPMLRAFAWHVPTALDVEAMDTAARLLEGQHDFSAFQSVGTNVSNAKRHIRWSRVREVAVDENSLLQGLNPAAGALLWYDVTGSGFLRHMVRSIAGTLVDIGRHRHPPSWMREVLGSRDRSRAGRTAPAEGLVLVRVEY